METLERGTDPTPEEVELVQVSRDEVDLLLREIHHRLMNTFSILAALLRRELSRPQNDIERVLARLEDMILAHAELHRSLCIGGEPLLPIGRCVSKMCLCLSRAILEPQGISCVVTTESGHARACDCQRLALIVCELVLNAAKYAFRKESPGRIQIELSRESEVWRCIVSDNGCGDTFSQSVSGQGSHLVDALARSVEASIERCSTAAGTTVVVLLPTNRLSKNLSASGTQGDIKPQAHSHSSIPTASRTRTRHAFPGTEEIAV
jgi:two-component sensor histidine kinase